MKILLLLLTLGITFPLAATDVKGIRILFLVDASASMATPWPGQPGNRMGTVRTTLDAMAGVLGGRKTPPDIAIRVFGDQMSPLDEDACSDTRLIRSWAPASEGDLTHSLDRIGPRGSGSLVLALSGALSDLGSPSPNDLVLVIIDGLAQCDVDLEQAFGALSLEGDGADIHIFGFGLDPTAQALLSGYGAFHSVGFPAQLLRSMSEAVSRRLPLPLQQGPVELVLHGANSSDLGLEGLTVVGTWAKEAITIDLNQNQRTFSGGLGTASITVIGPENHQGQRLVRVPIQSESRLQVTLFDPVPVDLSISLRPSGWGLAPMLDVGWSGAPEGEIQLVLQQAGAHGASWLNQQTVTGPTGQASLPLPSKPQELAVQLRKSKNQGDLILAEGHFSWKGHSVTLEAPPSAEAGTSVAVSWDGDSFEGDILTLVPAAAAPEHIGEVFFAVEGPPRDFLIPFDQCLLEIRYIDRNSFQILARSPLEVQAKTAGLMAPPSVKGSEPVDVRWWGPAATLDVITLALTDTESKDYLSWASPSEGSPARLQAPSSAGTYEIRYIDERDSVLASRPLVVEEIGVSIMVAETVHAGRRLKVSWSGPNSPDDFLVIVREGDTIKHYRDFAYVSVGSPTSLAAPGKPGMYEVQYIAAHPQRVLASVIVKIIK